MLLPAPPPPDLALARRVAPVLVLDARERDPLTAVGAATVRVPGAPPATEPTAYARVTRDRVQFWLFYADNPQDRGILRTGRHEGDWELVQVERDGTVVASQHSGAEACGPGEYERRDGHPVVYVANGSHANYLQKGTRDRTFPDPNDEATGDGRTIRPRVALVTADAPAWMRWPGRWGATRARPIPWESDSPRGPRFQGVRWDDPARLRREAAACAPGPNRTEPALAVAGILALAAVGWRFVRRRRRALPPA